MILEEETFKKYGYYSWEWKPPSNKPILAACDRCSKIRETTKHAYHTLCKSCSLKGRYCSNETREKNT